ncbi:unnamed protein product [Lactuca virosa]|uniref:Uncharacterized protein n=1 Tax=Lactuca virosa TaxID=75947 RepID=A0AAU9NES4_9ASTR|nr:unnamed protein product [Lactuca virosa]
MSTYAFAAPAPAIQLTTKVFLMYSHKDTQKGLSYSVLAIEDANLKYEEAEEEALMFQHVAVSEDSRQFEQRIRPYVDQVLLYENSRRQDTARKTVPVEKLEEKALVALAKEGNFKPCLFLTTGRGVVELINCSTRGFIGFCRIEILPLSGSF